MTNPNQRTPCDEDSDPWTHGGVWTPWKEVASEERPVIDVDVVARGAGESRF